MAYLQFIYCAWNIQSYFWELAFDNTVLREVKSDCIVNSIITSMGWKSYEPQGGIRWEQCLPIPDHTWVIDTKMANLSLEIGILVQISVLIWIASINPTLSYT